MELLDRRRDTPLLRQLIRRGLHGKTLASPSPDLGKDGRWERYEPRRGALSRADDVDAAVFSKTH